MVLTVFLISLLLIVIYLLLVPIVLFIDTSTHQYYLQIKGLVKANIETDEKELLLIKMKVLFFNFSFYPLKKSSAQKKRKTAKKTQSKKSRKRISFQTGLRLLKSFKLKRVRLDIDTNDCITNAKLYPIMAFLNYKIGGFNVNFEGRNVLLLSMENRPIRVIRSFINI